ncbi:MAG: hypothetical protein KKC76_20330 [Proteobacteria bacterium]|nr:hypothetical protein [Pseudomonadota bacterium]MBU4294435.1 hypothetical protein [Pseudomonadota bacterium]
MIDRLTLEGFGWSYQPAFPRETEPFGLCGGNSADFQPHGSGCEDSFSRAFRTPLAHQMSREQIRISTATVTIRKRSRSDKFEQAVKLIPPPVAYYFKVIPLFEIEGVLTIAMADPVDILSLDTIVDITNTEVEVVISS